MLGGGAGATKFGLSSVRHVGNELARVFCWCVACSKSGAPGEQSASCVWTDFKWERQEAGRPLRSEMEKR